MNLVIDVGNTRIKAGIFDGYVLQSSFLFKTINELLEASIFLNYTITHCIIGTVADLPKEQLAPLIQKTQPLLFTSDISIPLKNLYKTASTLGGDRLAVAIAANSQYPNTNVLAIDMGTCIKYNFITDKNEYLGGGISPGLQMRFNALHRFTARLPQLTPNDLYYKLIGETTDESILSGVQIGALAEIEGIIEKYKEAHQNLKVIITGGDVNFFENKLKKPIFADSYLTLKGLNIILEFNKSKQ